MKRRELLKTAALSALAAPAMAFTPTDQQDQNTRTPASDRIRIGMIGVGGFGLGTNLPDFLKNPDVDVVAICDVYEPRLTEARRRSPRYLLLQVGREQVDLRPPHHLRGG